MSGTLYRLDVDGTVTTERHEGKGPAKLEQLQRLVGGYIERVRVVYMDRHRDAYINEEGLLHNLPRNRHATALLAPLYYGCQLHGPCVIWVPDPKVKS
jgi:hypothetical protein